MNQDGNAQNGNRLPVRAGARFRRRVVWAAAAALAIVAAVVAEGAWQRPADPVEPLVLQRSERLSNAPRGETISVATFNTHAGVGRDGIRDLDRTAAALKNLDLAALQEVRNPLLSLGGPQVAAVADRLSMAWVFVPAERRWWHNDYGNALLTRIPLSGCIRIPLPTASRRRFRAALLANFQLQNRTVHLLAVHIDKDLANDTHDEQLRTVFDLFLSLGEPAILLGDLNEFGSHPELTRLLQVPGVRNALAGIPGPTVKKDPIDWIITRGLRTVRAEWVATPASDHPAARAELAPAAESLAESSGPERTTAQNR